MDPWKEFQVNPVTHSISHHLAAIAELVEQYGYARVADVARHLNITPGSVSLTLKPLKARGLVLEDPNRFLRLSDEAQQIVRTVRTRRTLIQAFFEQVLGVEPHQAEVDACKIEHLLSAEVGRRLEAFLRAYDRPQSGKVAGRSKAASLRRRKAVRC